MTSSFSPRALDVRALAREGAEVTRTDPLSEHPRLAEEAVGDLGKVSVHWVATGSMRAGAKGEPEVWLHLVADAVIPLTCQRCLTPVDVPLQVDQRFRFVADEATAEAEDDEADEDVLALTPEFDLPTLVEDELLMALPIVPRHDRCQPAAPLATADLGAHQVPQKPNPFAVLATLRGGNGHKPS